jgi:hypothetical protein
VRSARPGCACGWAGAAGPDTIGRAVITERDSVIAHPAAVRPRRSLQLKSLYATLRLLQLSHDAKPRTQFPTVRAQRRGRLCRIRPYMLGIHDRPQAAELDADAGTAFEFRI